MIITDIETNGLYFEASKFHTAFTHDTRTGIYKGYEPKDFQEYLNDLNKAVSENELIVFHNGVNYDSPVLSKLSKGFSIPKENLLDTLLLSRLIYSNLFPMDIGLTKRGIKMGKRMGSHSLEAWGLRLGELKGEYKDDFKAAVLASGEEYSAGDEWLNFSKSMYDYCKQDVVVTTELLKKLLSNKWYFKPEIDFMSLKADEFWSSTLECVKLEHDCASLMSKQYINGYPFYYNFAEKTQSTLLLEQNQLLIDLQTTFGSWVQPRKTPNVVYFRHPKTDKPLAKYAKVVYPKVGKIEPNREKKSLYTKDCPYTPIEYVEFNPSSREHIQKVLLDAGWQPVEKTPSGEGWAVSEEILEKVEVEDPIAQSKITLINKYLVNQKRLSMFNSWLKLYNDKTGAIHGSVNTNGAATGRATHSNPNLAQVTSATFDKKTHEPLWGDEGKWGSECRYVFGAEWHDNWYQVGVDASGLELRVLSHYMQPFDGGEYADEILNGDIHTKNQLAAGLPTRDNAKTFIYGYIYGAGDAKVGEIIKGTAKEGKAIKVKFLESLPALAMLKDSITNSLVESATWVGKQQVVKWKRQWVKGLDGRMVPIKSPHSALNYILQGAGAIICKYWGIRTEERLQALGLKHGWDGDYAQMAWVHDEYQWATKTKEVAEIIVRESQEAMRDTQKHFNFRCQLDTEGKIGKTWLDCH